jgi:molybdate transport system ATP-binding protein
MLEIDVYKRLRDFDLNLKLKVADGETLMLVGENGCGKTTLLNIIAGLTSPESGEIVISGHILFDSASSINIAPESRNIGYVFQNYALFPHLSVYENVAFGLRTRKLSRYKIEECVRDQLKTAGLWDLRDIKAAKISGGEKQRVALSRALITQPSMLLLDEPLAALDLRSHAAMRKRLKSILNDYNVPGIIVTHDIRDIIGMGDKLCLLENGKIAFYGKPDDAMNEMGFMGGPSNC